APEVRHTLAVSFRRKQSALVVLSGFWPVRPYDRFEETHNDAGREPANAHKIGGMERSAAARCVRSAAPEPRGHPAGARLSRSVFVQARTGVRAASADPSIWRDAPMVEPPAADTRIGQSGASGSGALKLARCRRSW